MAYDLRERLRLGLTSLHLGHFLFDYVSDDLIMESNFKFGTPGLWNLRERIGVELGARSII